MRASPLAFFLLLLTACSRPAAPSSEAAMAVKAPFWSNVTEAVHLSANDPQWEKRRWLEKAVHLLRGGQGLRAGENPDELLKQTPEEIVDKLMLEPRFGDMALDFNMYFLGFKTDRVHEGKYYDQTIYSFPAAIQSAREVLTGGDYFKLLDLEAPLFMQRVIVLDKTDAERQQPNLDIFRARYKLYVDSGQAVVDYVKNDPSATKDSACKKQEAQLNDYLPVILMGVPLNFVLDVMVETPQWYANFYDDCYAADTPLTKLAADFESIQNMNVKLFTLLEPYADDAYHPENVSLIQVFDLKKELGIEKRTLSWGTVQRQALTNSSTNMDRKRAAYVLKRFFCDDLTPVGIEDDPNHGGGAHGSQPSCRACHYKLDPMAGFFRGYGRRFKDYNDFKNITFDDGAKVNLKQYMTAWKGTTRDWDVGYVRSVSDETRNDYGSVLEDLHTIFRRAPEVKSCLVRRAFEYAVGDTQTMDPGYLDGITKEFSVRAATDSSGAFRWLAKQVALSHTFSQPDPVATQCYDYQPGVDPASRPPCRVAYLLEQNCKSCHASTADHGWLSLVDWAPGPDGVMTFPHLGADGKPLPLRATLENMINRLTTTDPEDRMPSKGKFMSAQDRQALYIWAKETLDGLKR